MMRFSNEEWIPSHIKKPSDLLNHLSQKLDEYFVAHHRGSWKKHPESEWWDGGYSHKGNKIHWLFDRYEERLDIFVSIKGVKEDSLGTFFVVDGELMFKFWDCVGKRDSQKYRINAKTADLQIETYLYKHIIANMRKI